MMPAGAVEAFNTKRIKTTVRDCFFSKPADTNKKKKSFAFLFYLAFLECCKVTELDLAGCHIAAMPWNVRRA